MLISGFAISSYEHQLHGCWLLVNTLANSAACLRLYMRVNKCAL